MLLSQLQTGLPRLLLFPPYSSSHPCPACPLTDGLSSNVLSEIQALRTEIAHLPTAQSIHFIPSERPLPAFTPVEMIDEMLPGRPPFYIPSPLVSSKTPSGDYLLSLLFSPHC